MSYMADTAGLLAPTHATYLVISVVATIWVAQTLKRHGRLFLVDVFHGNVEFADAVNHLLVVGFYLINIGWVCLNISGGDVPLSAAQMLEVLGSRVGVILLVLGLMHFFNLYLFSRMRRRALTSKAPPPVYPAQVIAPPRVA